MYIPCPAKLLFQHDDGWSQYLDKHGDTLSDWTKLAVERMLACGTCAMSVRRYCCASPGCTHARFFCQSCKSKAYSSCGLKATEQWIAEQQHILPDCDWQHITFTMPHLLLLCLFFNNNWPLLNDLFRCATRAMLRWARQQGIEVGIFCALHTYPTAGSSINTRISTFPSPAADLISSTAPGVTCSLKRKKWKPSGAMPSSICCGTTTPASIPAPCRASAISATRTSGTATCMPNIGVARAKKTRCAWRSVKYLGRYLKRPPVAASQLRHYRGGSVVHQYYDHNTQQHKRQKISQEEMLQRYVSHIPARHFKMVRYYGFLGTDPYQCILCKGRLRFAGAVAGEHATKLLSDGCIGWRKNDGFRPRYWISAPEKWVLA